MLRRSMGLPLTEDLRDAAEDAQKVCEVEDVQDIERDLESSEERQLLRAFEKYSKMFDSRIGYEAKLEDWKRKMRETKARKERAELGVGGEDGDALEDDKGEDASEQYAHLAREAARMFARAQDENGTVARRRGQERAEASGRKRRADDDRGTSGDENDVPTSSGQGVRQGKRHDDSMVMSEQYDSRGEESGDGKSAPSGEAQQGAKPEFLGQGGKLSDYFSDYHEYMSGAADEDAEYRSVDQDQADLEWLKSDSDETPRNQGRVRLGEPGNRRHGRTNTHTRGGRPRYQEPEDSPKL
jgi:hypothetical protein